MPKHYSWNDKVVLVVEDDPSSLMLLQTILSRTGAKLLVAEDGETAVSLVQDNSDIDLILMDIRLKGLSGLEATEQIKKINPKTPVIAQTACAIVGDMEMCLQAGCNAYLAKPIVTETLLETMDYYFKKSMVQDIFDSVWYAN
ncbi:MAG TPA: response regulator [Tenuifilaceae bacterium]|nr:response regulator [Tenuifilaceae bacterium]HPE19278.1 response regulator [Tenuifilaceae bacterium]HPJ46699.1 response regulator [Tenuifilaceae bacterium]HPQ35000.1 response regulator [Tenuifilaceae bacterium]HRX68558.1 response regulator [Tenuifilaceae bacterium]